MRPGVSGRGYTPAAFYGKLLLSRQVPRWNRPLISCTRHRPPPGDCSMDAPSPHPTDQTLKSHGVGKLDDRSAGAVDEHLIGCSDCRKRVAEVSANDSLENDRDARKAPAGSTSGPPRSGVTPNRGCANAPGP